MKYFIYCRKSSEDKSRQIQSIDDQKNVLLKLAKDRGLSVADIIIDEKSAKQPGREGFTKMISRIETGEVTGIICWKLDRLARNPIDGGSISWLLQRSRIQEIVTPDKTYFPTDNVILTGIEFGMANQYIIDLQKNVKRGMVSKVEKGWLPSKAPLGYVNEKYADKGSKRILPDPVLFDVIQSLWKALMRNRLNMAALYEVMAKDYPIYRNGSLLAFSTFHRIFHNPFYAGLFVWNGEKHLGLHKPMISISDFEEAQRILGGVTQIRDGSLSFDLKGVFKCGHCGGQITAERHNKLVKKTGEYKEYDYYHCSHNKKGITCKEQQLSKKELEDQLLKLVEETQIPEEILQFGLEELDRMKGYDSETLKEKTLKQELTRIDSQMKNAVNLIISETEPEIRNITKDKILELKIEKRRREEDLQKAEEEKKDPFGEIRNSFEVVMHAKQRLINGTPEQKRNIVRGLGLNWEIKEKKLYYKPFFTIEAIRKTKSLLEGVNNGFEPAFSDYQSTKNLTSEVISSIWSR